MVTIQNKNNLKYDAFIIYNNEDQKEVEYFAKRQHEENNLKIWFDKWNEPNAINWLDAIENELFQSKSIVFCVGKSGVGPWKKIKPKKLKSALRRYFRSGHSVIPVLLPSASKKPRLPNDYRDIPWVDYLNNSVTAADKQVILRIEGLRINAETKNLFGSSTIKKNETNILPPVEGDKMGDLQDQINRTSKNGIVELHHGAEFREKIVIKKPLKIRSTSTPATIVESSPTVTIQCKNVIIDNLNIVCNDKNGTCLLVKKKSKPSIDNVFVKGKVEGLEGEEGDWEIPEVLELSIVPNKINKKKIIVNCPVPAKIYPLDIAIVSCTPQDLNSGINEIIIQIDEFFKDSFITGNLIIETLSYKLKRKVALTGNSLDLGPGAISLVEECIWVCPSAKSTINPEVLKQLPKGTQGEPYEFILDENSLNCKEYNIRVDNLPNGLSFNKLLIPKIEGIPKKFGEFEIDFVFEKDNLESEYSSKLIIAEKVILPLNITPIKDPVKLVEDEMAQIKIDVTSSNSPNLTFKTLKDLPGGLQLNEVSGELWGKITEHGKYNTTIIIDDGTNVLKQDINFHVMPQDPLTLDIKKSYQFYKNDDFEIELTIPDAVRLFPKIQLKDQHSGQLKIESIHGDHFLKGKLTETKTYVVDINIEDTYKRNIKDVIQLQCVEKPSYTFKWLTTSLIHKKGQRLKRFSEQIKAEINENKSLTLKYFCTGKLPKYFKLTEDGWLEGIIDGNSHSINIRAKTGEWQSDKKFEIITDIESSSKIIKSDQLQPGVFVYKDDTTEKIQIKIKNDLKKGRVKESYNESLLAEYSNIPPNFSLKISNLPKGLTYNYNTHIIEGKPEEEGLYRIDVFNPINKETCQTKLEIAKSPYFHENSPKSETSDKKRSKPDTKIKLGKAFK